MTEAIDLGTANEFIPRHIGPRDADTASMLEQLGYDSLDALIASVIPESIKGSSVLELSAGLSEADALAKIKAIAVKNQQFSTHIGQGYYGTRSCATCWKTRPGTPPTPLTSRKFPRAAWKPC